MLSTPLDIATRQVQYQLSVATRHQVAPRRPPKAMERAGKARRDLWRSTTRDEQQSSLGPKQIDGCQMPNASDALRPSRWVVWCLHPNAAPTRYKLAGCRQDALPISGEGSLGSGVPGAPPSSIGQESST